MINGGSTQSDDNGFDKTLVFMTKPNKIIAISSLKGNLLWSRFIKDPVRRMVLDLFNGEATLEVVTEKGQFIKIDPMTGTILSSEPLPNLP